MKGTICLILCLLLFAGCSPQSNAPQPTEPTALQSAAPTLQTEPTLPSESTAPTENTVLPSITYPNPLVAVSLPLIDEVFSAQDGTVLCNYTAQEITVALQDPLVAQAITEDLQYRTFASPAQSIFLAAQSDYSGQSDWTPYRHSILYSPTRIDMSVLSLYGQQIVHTDAPYATASTVSVNYSTITGRALTLWEVLTEDYSADALCSAIVEALQAQSLANSLYPDYSSIISDLFSTNTATEHWFFTTDGLCFYFDPYEIAPHSAGTILAEVPYAQLSGILKDDYFPAEEIPYWGNAIFSDFDQTDVSKFHQFAEVVSDASAEQRLFYTDGALLNVRLEIGTWEGDSFTPEAVIFAAEALSCETALVVQFPNSDLSRLRLSYVSGGEQITTRWDP